MKKLLTFVFFSLIFFGPVTSQIVIDNTLTNNQLAQSLAGNGVFISNVTGTGSLAKFTNGNIGTLNIGIGQGVLLTSGNVFGAIGPNDAENTSTNNGLPGNALLNGLGQGTTTDASVLEFDIVASGNTLTFNYVFASEEYNEFVGAQYNDVVGIFISGPGIQGSQNIALVDGADPVSVNNINAGFSLTCPATGQGVNRELYRNNCNGPVIEYDGFTRVLQAVSPLIIPCQTYHITIAIADVGDATRDSGIFIAGESLNSPGGTEFTVTANCTNNWSVTATALDPTLTNNRWELWCTTVEGETNGGTLVSTINGGLSATFSWLDLSKFYYIRHVRNTCNVIETRLVVPDFSGTANADFILEDANGTKKDIFCFGEDIYFNGTASYNYDRFYINVTRRPAGSNSNVPFDHHAQYGWTMSNNIGVFNLSQAFENHSLPAFEPGFEYEIQLAIMNPANCVPWVEFRRTFTVVCCEGYLNAAFREELVDNGGSTSFTLNALDFESYGANIVHEWLIFSSQTWNSGPYTLVHQTTTTGAGPVQLYTQGQYGRFYFIVHRLSTACGDICYGQIVEGTILPFSTSPQPDGNVECELCGPLDCDVVDELCVAPDGEYTYCTSFPSNGVVFNWNPTQNATQYRVQLLLNDPSCCGEGDQSSQTYNVNTTYLVLGGMARSCFSWRVGAVCEGQTIWSEYHCFRGCEALLSGNMGTGQVQPASDASKTPEQQPVIYPNPANDELNIALPLETKVDLVRLIDLQGKVVFEQHSPEQHLKIDSARFIAGMYAVQIIYPDGRQTTAYVVVTH